jgi:serine/threonine protein kinase/lipoprotein NlpI
MSVKIGQTISHYRILEEIGAGGMAIVYKAEDINLKRLVALKFLPPQLTVNKETRKRFITEAQSASALDHPNICTIFEIGKSEDDQMFIAMGFYDGETLKDKISRGPLDTKEAINITLQTAEGLSKAHEKGIIHRDIKPANIMITGDGVVKILDFGLAKLSGHTTLTKTGTMLGTAVYMSPEQASGEKVDHRSDIWSLGILLYEMLSGKPPFQGDNEQAVVYAILNKDPKPIASYRKDLPDYIEKAIYKSLVKDPDNRYQTIQELVKDLKAKSAPDIDLPVKENSIVVLPFKDFSEKKENEYFSDGLTEEIITDLSKVRDLLVISRSSAMTFKGTNKKVKEIGKELNIQYALEGSVRKAGNNIRISAQLIDAQNDTHLWAEKYSGTLEDVFDIQEKVSRSIVDALQLKLNPDEEQKIAKRPIKNIQAYECYLRARQESWGWTPDALERALRYLQNGLDIIGENSILYAGMGYVYSMYVNLGIGPDSYIDKAEEYAAKALELDPESSEALLVIGFLNYEVYGQQQKAIKYFRQVLAQDPNEPHTIQWLCEALVLVGRTEEAKTLAEKLLQIDPLTPMNRAVMALVNFFEGDTNQSIDRAAEWLRLESNNPAALYYYSMILVFGGRSNEASEIVDEYINRDWDDTFTKLSLLVKYIAERDTKRIEGLLTGGIEKKIKRDTQYSYFTAMHFALAGMNEEALSWLEKAVDREFCNYPFVSAQGSIWDNIRGEKRFKKLMNRMKYQWEHLDI